MVLRHIYPSCSYSREGSLQVVQGRIVGMTTSDGNSLHTYGLLDDYFIIDLTLDGFSASDGEKGPRIVALPEWAPFVQSRYRYHEENTKDLNRKVHNGHMYIEEDKWKNKMIAIYRDRWSESWELRGNRRGHSDSSV